MYRKGFFRNGRNNRVQLLFFEVSLQGPCGSKVRITPVLLMNPSFILIWEVE